MRRGLQGDRLLVVVDDVVLRLRLDVGLRARRPTTTLQPRSSGS